MMRKDELQEWLNELNEATWDAMSAEKSKNRIKALTQISVVIGKIRKYAKYNESTDRILNLLTRPKMLFDEDLVDALVELEDEMNEDIKKLEDLEDVVDAFKEGCEEIKDTVAYAVDETAEKAKAVAGKAKDGAKYIEKKARTALRDWIMKED